VPGPLGPVAQPAGWPPGNPLAPHAFIALRNAAAAAPVGLVCGWPLARPPPGALPGPNPGGGVTPCCFRHWLNEAPRAPGDPEDAGDGAALLAAHPAVTVAASRTGPRTGSQARRPAGRWNTLINAVSLGSRRVPARGTGRRAGPDAPPPAVNGAGFAIPLRPAVRLLPAGRPLRQRPGNGPLAAGCVRLAAGGAAVTGRQWQPDAEGSAAAGCGVDGDGPAVRGH